MADDHRRPPGAPRPPPQEGRHVGLARPRRNHRSLAPAAAGDAQVRERRLSSLRRRRPAVAGVRLPCFSLVVGGGKDPARALSGAGRSQPPSGSFHQEVQRGDAAAEAAVAAAVYEYAQSLRSIV